MHRFLWCGLLCYLIAVGHLRAAENEPKVITLSCDGALTRTSGANKPMDMQVLQQTSVVVNLDDQTVFFLGYVVPISDVDHHRLRRKADRRLRFQHQHQGPY
jgi:hypothetical protein